MSKIKSTSPGICYHTYLEQKMFASFSFSPLVSVYLLSQKKFKKMLFFLLVISIFTKRGDLCYFPGAHRQAQALRARGEGTHRGRRWQGIWRHWFFHHTHPRTQKLSIHAVYHPAHPLHASMHAFPRMHIPTHTHARANSNDDMIIVHTYAHMHTHAL